MTAGRSAPPTAVEPGIHLLAIPTPFLVGRVNCYLIEGDPLTLVDTGPNSAKSFDELERALVQCGHRVEAVGQIVLTHQHSDHTGLVEVLVRRSGAEVVALESLAPWLAAYPASAGADDRFAQATMRRHGVPDDTVTALGAVSMAYRAFGSRGSVDRLLHDGDILELGGRRFVIQHRPGHSPTDTLFYDADGGLMIGGDHLLAKISSNPLISRPPDAPLRTETLPERPRALLDYLDSLRRTRELPVRRVLTGHGEPIEDHVKLIDERLRMHERRARKIRSMLAAGPRTAYEVAFAMWGNVAVTQAYLTLSEVVGHLDLLLEEGQVQEAVEGGVSRFTA